MKALASGVAAAINAWVAPQKRLSKESSVGWHYAYDDLVEPAQQALRAGRLVLIPTRNEVVHVDVIGGGKRHEVRCRMTYTLLHESGESIELSFEALGVHSDPSKGATIATTNAHKVLIRHLFFAGSEEEEHTDRAVTRPSEAKPVGDAPSNDEVVSKLRDKLRDLAAAGDTATLEAAIAKCSANWVALIGEDFIEDCRERAAIAGEQK